MVKFDNNKLLAKQTFIALLIQSSNVVVALASSILLARMLGAEGLGVYAFCMGITQVLVIPASLGLQQLLVREIATDSVMENWGRIRGFLWRGNQGACLSSVVLSACLVAWALCFESDNVDRAALLWVAVLIPFLALVRVNSSALRGLGCLQFSQLSEMMLRPLLFLAFMVVSLLVGGAFLASTAVAYQAISGIIVFLLVLVVLNKQIPSLAKLAQPVYEEKIWLKVSFFFMIISGLSALNSNLSVLLLGFFDLKSDAGHFQVAYRGSEVIAFGLIAVSYVVAPDLSRLYSQKENSKLAKLIIYSSKYVNIYAIVIGVVFFIFAEKIILLIYGPNYSSAVLPFRVLCVAQMFNSLFGYSGLILNMIGYEVLTIWCLLSGFILNLIISYFLIPDFGATGAAIASASGLVLWKGMTITILYVKFNIRCGPFLFCRVS